MNKVSKTETLHVRVTPEVKREAETLLNKMGMSTAEAINIFLSQVIINGCIPFTIHANVPNETTQQAMYEAENGINLTKIDNAQDMFIEEVQAKKDSMSRNKQLDAFKRFTAKNESITDEPIGEEFDATISQGVTVDGELNLG